MSTVSVLLSNCKKKYYVTVTLGWHDSTSLRIVGLLIVLEIQLFAFWVYFMLLVSSADFKNLSGTISEYQTVCNQTRISADN